MSFDFKLLLKFPKMERLCVNQLHGNLDKAPDDAANLVWVDFNSNNFTTMDFLDNQLKLEHLNLSNNQISKIPDTFRVLKRLNFLDLSSNKISEIPESIVKLENLSFLNLSNNMISEIPEFVVDLLNNPHFVKLDVSNNILTKIPEEIKNSPKFIFNSI